VLENKLQALTFEQLDKMLLFNPSAITATSHPKYLSIEIFDPFKKVENFS
jgi:hypothetical protein